jgi:hypothetical protein
MTRSETNTTQGLTTTYTAQLDARTVLVQSYTLYREARRESFGGVEFDVAPGTVKWSFDLSLANGSGELSSGVTDASKNGFTLRYRLSGVGLDTGNGSATLPTTAGKIQRKRDSPQQGMTTFAVVLQDDVVAQVEVLNVAMVDGDVYTLGRIDLVWINGSAAGSAGGYALELVFPPFERSVSYDPSIGLGVLLGRNDDDGGGSTDVGLAVGVAVAVSVAVAFVLVVVIVGLVLGWRQRKRWASAMNVNVGSDESDHEGSDML